MRYELTNHSLKFYIENPRSSRPQIKDASELTILPATQTRMIVEATLRRMEGREFRTRTGYIDCVLRSLGRYLVWSNRNSLPSNFEEWQFFISQWALWHVSSRQYSGSLESRCSTWNSAIRPWVSYLIDEDLIPQGISVPDLKLAQPATYHASKPMIAARRPRMARGIATETSVDKTIAGPIFWNDDVTYLDDFLVRLKEKNATLVKVLDDYWCRLVSDFRAGQHLINKISVEDFEGRDESCDWGEKIFSGLRKKTRVTSPSHPNGAAWTLRIIKNQLEMGDNCDCISLKNLRAHRAFNGSFARKNSTIKPLLKLSKLEPHQVQSTSIYLIVIRFLGLLNVLDMSVAMAILIVEHPNLTPESLAGAKLLCAKGKYYLFPTGERNRSIFSVDKPRAGSRKYCSLTHRSARIVRHLLRATEPVRELMKRAGVPQYRYLFLGMISVEHSMTLGHPRMLNAGTLHRSGGSTLLNYYPELAESGLEAGTLTYARIRNTQGVLAWFENGEVAACAEKLGNTEEVSMKHYIPAPLLDAWNERIIRRFQNTLIILASAKEDYLLNVADFSELSHLHHFLAQLVFESTPEGSPLSKKIHELFGERYSFCLSQENSVIKGGALMYVRLSGESLAFLIGYRNWAVRNLDATQLLRKDQSNARCPSDFVNLADLISTLAGVSNVPESIRESHDIARLKRIYSDAQLLIPTVTEKFNSMSISVR